MVVIPSLNCRDEECVHKKAKILGDMNAPWVHIDVADGIFAPIVLSRDARAIKRILEEEKYKGHIEVHLMVEHPEREFRTWLECGARRVIVHVEAIHNMETLRDVELECAAFGAELGIALKADTSEEKVEQFLGSVTFWTVLSVPIGFSGGIFEKEDALRKISFLRSRTPDVVIEIDGGMNEETGILVKDAGGDILVSGAFIFSHTDPREAFRILENL